MMIRRIFETHIPVQNLERAMEFYDGIPGLELGTVDEARRIAFYWVGGRNVSMLGLWENTSGEFPKQHYAFEIAVQDMDKALAFLSGRGIAHYNFLGEGTSEPMVFAWMPALAIYFKDLDGHELEFIAPLPGEARPEKGILSIDAWNTLAENPL